MKPGVDYTWRLAERGTQLPRLQVYRVVHERPAGVSLQVLTAWCDIFRINDDPALLILKNSL